MEDYSLPLPKILMSTSTTSTRPNFSNNSNLIPMVPQYIHSHSARIRQYCCPEEVIVQYEYGTSSDRIKLATQPFLDNNIQISWRLITLSRHRFINWHSRVPMSPALLVRSPQMKHDTCLELEKCNGVGWMYYGQSGGVRIWIRLGFGMQIVSIAEMYLLS